MPKKTTLIDTVADYIVDEMVINRASVNHPDKASMRAYAYYKRIKEHIDEIGPDGGYITDKYEEQWEDNLIIIEFSENLLYRRW